MNIHQKNFLLLAPLIFLIVVYPLFSQEIQIDNDYLTKGLWQQGTTLRGFSGYRIQFNSDNRFEVSVWTDCTNISKESLDFFYS